MHHAETKTQKGKIELKCFKKYMSMLIARPGCSIVYSREDDIFSNSAIFHLLLPEYEKEEEYNNNKKEGKNPPMVLRTYLHSF
jgi:hypothetical protein